MFRSKATTAMNHVEFRLIPMTNLDLHIGGHVAMLLFYFNVVANLVYCVYDYWEGEQICQLTPS